MELILDNIRKSYNDKQVLKGVDFTFEKGKIYGLLGRNGAGKTSLFNCLSGEVRMDSGGAFLKRNEVSLPLTENEIGYVFSLPILPEFLTGYEFVKFYMDINRDKIQPGRTVEDYFNIISFEEEDRHRLIKGYSHGMKNKIQMLCFIITRPPLILLDEPLTSFDVVVALEIKKLLREMKQDHIIIFSTHILQLAADLCDELVILNNGILQEIPSDLLRSPEFEEKIIALLKDGNSHA
ncbi:MULTISPECIES: ABC transporter ATP-binding protein [unclassified Paenibacillus]|uniref:ABC transporter ATP-binding protein n=1 Tax=unclassified Paenibacillus TaxID=185978 RepID=UPI002405A9E2|nr:MULTISPECIES: ABC transporter ATP-binding protein [unclassified Paenibacillus]MDF9843880.1 ABC-2 type transport system ATP-binding protein [Paenibacillus sp. PastF-2]MDF9850436.1 ABC-2 type transport system ATP-binding protein [Paenibacillus sp. PastM-2]MDF9857059.1 ABC-2 type transport system ATP-binding protein [Paenibacillus sp. PastF-1]MDH6482331.1 ABC-2 type transport system ATP-binding protein [Paenibacillus sp. PastH-2]MDH6509702.1 ABC-2 type transport system ATP-binding protein [Pae